MSPPVGQIVHRATPNHTNCDSREIQILIAMPVIYGARKSTFLRFMTPISSLITIIIAFDNQPTNKQTNNSK
jgi:hypothetical protein